MRLARQLLLYLSAQLKPYVMSDKKKHDALRPLFDDFIRECKYTHRRRPETLRGYEAVFSTFLKLCPQASLDTLTPQTITQFFETLQTRQRVVGKGTVTQGVKDSTVGTYSSKLFSFFTWLVKEGHLPKNPLEGVKRVYPVYDDNKMLRKNEVQKIRAAIELRLNNLLQVKRDRAILSILLFCGLRREELLGLNVMDVDLERRQLKVKAETSKSKRTRTLPINRELHMLIEDYLEERRRQKKYTTPSLIVSLMGDSGLTKDGLKHWVDNLKRLSGVRFHVHQFRHTFACNAYMKCKDPLAIQHLLGHADLRMTTGYLRSFRVSDFDSVMDSLSFDSLL